MKRARSGSDALLSRFDGVEPERIYPASIQALEQATEWPITSQVQISLAQRTLKKQAFVLCQRLKPERALPALVDAASRIYAGSSPRHQSWLGPTIKLCIGMIWENVGRATAITSSTADLEKAIKVTAALTVIRWIESLSVFAGPPSLDHPVRLTDVGVVLPSLYATALVGTMREDTAALRAPNAGAGRLAADIDGAKSTIRQVLGGAAPASMPLLEGTSLATIPAGEGAALWTHLWTLISLAEAVGKESLMGHGDIDGVVLLPDPFIVAVPHAKSHRQEVSDLLFWTPKWYSRLSDDDMINAVVERPMIRSESHNGHYATSMIFLMDSIAWGIECAFFGYARSEPLRLPEAMFQRGFADPLELQVISTFRSLGFRAGKVTHAGAWDLGHSIENVAGQWGAPPGEVDCLAMSPTGDVFLMECKVLRLPLVATITRNLVSKLGSDDSDGFHANLRKKRLWVGKALGRPVRAALVVDRGPPLVGLQPEHPVVFASALRQWIVEGS